MIFDAKTIFTCFIVPALCGALGWALCFLMERRDSKGREDGEEEQNRSNFAAAKQSSVMRLGIMPSIGIGLALIVHFTAHDAWDVNESWLRFTAINYGDAWFAILLIGLLCGLSFVCCRLAHWRQIAAAACASLATLAVMPLDSGYKDLFPIYPNWLGLAVVFGGLNIWAIESMVERDGRHWVGWVLVAWSCLVTMSAAAVTRRPAELAIISMCFCFAVAALNVWRPYRTVFCCIAPVSTLLISTIVKVRIEDYVEHPSPFWLTLLGLPILIALLDWVFSKLGLAGKTWPRVILAATLSISCGGLVAWHLFGNSDW